MGVFPSHSLISSEEHRPIIFRNRMLRRMSGPKREKVTGRLEKTAIAGAS
jgi:hypothetical protein